MRMSESEYLCHGLACPKHADCERYRQAEGAVDHPWWMATCQEDGQYPKFIKVEAARGSREID